MKIAKTLLFFWVLFLTLGSCAASAEKAMHERKNFMMPKTNEIKRNSHYKDSKSKKTYKHKSKKKKSKNYKRR